MEAVKENILLLISTPIYLIIICIELLISNYGSRKLYSLKDTVTNIYLMLLNSIIDLAFRSIYIGVIFTFFYKYRIINNWQSAIWYWLFLLLAEDFLYYWLHRFDHKIRFFWAAHVTHHSSQKMNFTVGFRSSVFQPLYRFIYFIPLPLLGFKPLDIVFMYSATQIWGIFVHTELVRNMGWLEYIFVTPSHHRVHHGSNAKYIDKNMGMFLIIWDKLFGTFQKELDNNEYEPIKYGLTTEITNPNAMNIIFHEWNQIRKDLAQPKLSFKQKWLYIFGKPGYKHHDKS
ncbi:MAG TPA: sterol desaturase family protein [Chitinophagaceae bacterium]|nr:sterol desaturase family protein [Chitinophagaceae bacterium]MCC6634370.1 sterol desaturase family protein [Chitinophagaceae bacterium]HMZ46909.1 sterol desaturase family protein [Chitinophagaceae bacterium]HNE93338.1 sterol desaturase family protein [Chitinophagaceae bacterium]HNF29515.1 sterol desaturase family protein [Chitinophagaceae bacterium]